MSAPLHDHSPASTYLAHPPPGHYLVCATNQLATRSARATMETAERERIATRLHAAAIHLPRAVRREDPASGLSPARLSARSVLVYAGPPTLGARAGAVPAPPPATARLVAAVETGGDVAR